MKVHRIVLEALKEPKSLRHHKNVEPLNRFNMGIHLSHASETLCIQLEIWINTVQVKPYKVSVEF